MQLFHTFISYARPDAEFALKLANDLRAAGVNVWLDQLDIPPGARWDRAVETALETCGRLLIVLSPTSAESENVQDEIGVAFDNNKPIVPILRSPCEVPMRLRRLQYIDFTGSYENAFATLLTVLKLPVTVAEAGGAAEQQSPAAGTIRSSADAARARNVAPVAPPRATASTRNRNLGIAGAVAVLVVAVAIWSGSGGSSTGSDATDATGEEAAVAGEETASTGGTESTFASIAAVTVVNRSDRAIHEMYMRAAGAETWGRELLGADVEIEAEGGAHTVSQVPCGAYDVRLVDQERAECVIPGQNVCDEDLTWEFTAEDLEACQSR